ncbi:MAG: hypothetical protein ABI467_01470 [Kofleriaceae bacterium]
MMLRRAFVVAWIVLAVAGALAHTVAERVVGHTIDLGLPELRYGYVMFNANPRRVPVYTFARADGERHDLADLDPRPAFGYKRARVALDAMFSGTYLRDLCNRALTSRDDQITIFIDGYQVDVDREHPAMATTEVCGGRR